MFLHVLLMRYGERVILNRQLWGKDWAIVPIRDSKTAEIPRPNVRGAGFLPFRAVQDRPTSRVAAT
ncbi:hypothetical protein MCC01959_09840 [Bifidobacteriaceae bacterium MCC01959]|nr:hypothetical protein MCC01959_09840 [Bifidobacteriaceae bacterium MCC01959]